MNQPIEIPNKSSFKVNEVCALTGVKSYVLRFWESEFTEIAPLMSSMGVKLYSHIDIEAILLIKKLLFDDKLTIERAKREMKLLMSRESSLIPDFQNFSDIEAEEEIFTSPEPAVFSQTKRVLVESDFQKLMMAKSKLSEILSLTESLHQTNHWK